MRELTIILRTSKRTLRFKFINQKIGNLEIIKTSLETVFRNMLDLFLYT